MTPQINLNAHLPAIGDLITEALRNQRQGKTQEALAALIDAHALIYPAEQPKAQTEPLQQARMALHAIKNTADEVSKMAALASFAATDLDKPEAEASMTQYELAALLGLISQNLDTRSDFLYSVAGVECD